MKFKLQPVSTPQLATGAEDGCCGDLLDERGPNAGDEER